ncbi:MAG: IclR family transcriptional regulator [Rhodobacterales bacterium]|nr:IclR family transcriptional regulator [Rhodobacterales bacterium]
MMSRPSNLPEIGRTKREDRNAPHLHVLRHRGLMSSVARAIAVVDHLARNGAMGVRALAKALDLPLGSVHRLMIDLAAERVVEQTADGAWQMSYRLIEIVDFQIDQVGFPRIARPHCDALARFSGETVNLNILSSLSCVCIDKVRGNESMQLDWRIGARGPLHCGGSAKAMLAYLDSADQARVLAGPLHAYNAHTITDPAALRSEIAAIRARGYALDQQEIVMGVFCVGVPILDRRGLPVGAISVSGTSPKAPGPVLEPLVARLFDAARAVSQRLGHAGPFPPRDTFTASRSLTLTS